jgi:predicted O-methyltransferase YrrM
MLFQKFSQRGVIKKISGFRQLDGWLTDAEAFGLYQMASSLKQNATVVEIGSWQGKSSYCIASGLKSGTLFAIDPFNGDAGDDIASSREYAEKKTGKNLEQIFLQNMLRLGVSSKIQINKGYSQDFHEQFTDIDALFIDGDHSYTGCSNDFYLYAGKIVPGGYLAFHDYYPDRGELGPTQVIERLVKPDPHYIFHKLYDSLWVARKRKL